MALGLAHVKRTINHYPPESIRKTTFLIKFILHDRGSNHNRPHYSQMAPGLAHIKTTIHWHPPDLARDLQFVLQVYCSKSRVSSKCEMCCNSRRSGGLLRRENEQTAIEGPRTARTHDGITGAPGTRKRAHRTIFRVFCPMCRAGRVHLLAVPRVLVCVCSPPSWCADGWFKGVASLLMGAFNAIRTAAKPPAAQALNPARPAHPNHPPVDTLDSVCSFHSQHTKF